jgi:hypothetical protein
VRIFITTICLLFCLSGLAFANLIQIDPDKLTPEQVQQRYALKQAAYPGKTPTPTQTLEMLEKYPAIGTAVAKAIGSACKELGVELNEFAKTPVGKLTIAVILYKVVAVGAMKSFLLTIMWLIVVMGSWRFYKRTFIGSEKNPKYEFKSGEAKAFIVVCNILIPAIMTVLWICLV